jgi:hypothetical protein
LGTGAAFNLLSGHNFLGLGSSSSDTEESASEPHQTLSSISASSSRSSSTTTDGLSKGLLAKAFNLGSPCLLLPETSFKGRLRELSGETIFCRSSLELPEAFSGASLICRFARALSVGNLTTSLEVSKSLSESFSKTLLMLAYDFWALLRGEVRSSAVVFVVVLFEAASSLESLPIGLALRSRAILMYV